MTQAAYDVVVKLVDQLSPEEQQALIEHLQESAKQRDLSFEEWKAVFDSMKISTPVIGEFSDRRVDWYDDDGR